AGILAYEQALARNPTHAPTMFNLAACLLDVGRDAQGENLYRAAIATDPRFAPAYVNLGNCHFARGEYPQALELYQGALAQQADMPEALDAEAICLQRLGQWQQAMRSNQKAMEVHGLQFDRVMRQVGIFEQLGQSTELADFLTHITQAQAPDSPYHFVKAAKSQDGAAVPPVAPHAFVQAYFDWTAAAYDQSALSENYLLPAHLARHLQHLPEHTRVLDLGCGTGLLAAYPTQNPLHFTGVDLSSAMLVYAQQRNAYSDIKQQALEYFCAQSAPAAYDVVVAAELLPYLGRPEGLLAQVHSVLKEGGLLYLSLEHHDSPADDASIRLSRQLRYTHSPVYVQGMAEKLGFATRSSEEHIFRTTPQKAVKGTVLCFEKK
ncbi:MAG: hypothetical protein RLZZ502_1530, partial [Pseudomonadota bacterium]